jgi:hypothetical protein
LFHLQTLLFPTAYFWLVLFMPLFGALFRRSHALSQFRAELSLDPSSSVGRVDPKNPNAGNTENSKSFISVTSSKDLDEDEEEALPMGLVRSEDEKTEGGR